MRSSSTLNDNLKEQYPFWPVVISHKFESIHRHGGHVRLESPTAGELFLDYLSDFLNSLSRAMRLFVMENG